MDNFEMASSKNHKLPLQKRTHFIIRHQYLNDLFRLNVVSFRSQDTVAIGQIKIKPTGWECLT